MEPAAVKAICQIPTPLAVPTLYLLSSKQNVFNPANQFSYDAV